MSQVNRAIILAAGRGHQLDGAIKSLIKHPQTGQTVLDYAIDAFAGKKITVVVGFRAIQIMEQYPQLDFVINHDWAITNNAMSLGLALSDEPSYVVSGDIFFGRDLVEKLDNSAPDAVLTDGRENRTSTAVHARLNANNTLFETYQGPVKNARDPEIIGMFKISNPALLAFWKQQCIRNGNFFVGQTLPCEGYDIHAVDRGNLMFDEINTSSDYLRLLERTRPG